MLVSLPPDDCAVCEATTFGRAGEAGLEAFRTATLGAGFAERRGWSRSFGGGLLREGASGVAFVCGWPEVSHEGMRLPPRKAFAVELEVWWSWTAWSGGLMVPQVGLEGGVWTGSW